MTPFTESPDSEPYRDRKETSGGSGLATGVRETGEQGGQLRGIGLLSEMMKIVSN